MEKKKIWSILRIVVIVLQLLLQVAATFVVLKLDMLPSEYIVVFILAMILLLEATVLLMYLPVKNRVRRWRQIVAAVISVAIISGCTFVSKIGYDTYKLLNDFTGSVSNMHHSFVIVLSDNPVQSLAETKTFQYGAVSGYDEDHTQQLLQAIKQEINDDVDLTYYDQTSVMVDALYNKEIDAIIMNDTSVSLLVEQSGYEGFMSRVKVLHTMSFEVDDLDNVTNGEITTDPFVMYVSGSDTRSQKLTLKGRSDVNILAVVNPVTKQILLISTPRDFYIPNPAGKGALDKLTHCGNSGIDVSMKALGDLYNVDVGYYSQINFTGFEKLIDAIGGISVYSDQTYTAISGVHFEKGWNELNGNEAMWFVRERFNVSGGDRTRGVHQMQMIQAIFEKLTSSKTMVANYTDIIKSLEGMFVTSLSAEEIGDLVKMQLSDMSAWNVKSYSASGQGAYKETYSVPGQELYVMLPDEDIVAKAQELCQKVLNGEILTDADVEPVE